jgi:hypothetical protein
MSGQIPMSLCVITCDAAAPIADGRAPTPRAGESGFVDSGSSDDTVESLGRGRAGCFWNRSVGHRFPEVVAGFVPAAIGAFGSLAQRAAHRVPRTGDFGR